ncbi:Transposase and inactivated derivatives [hydrothermal vent metagenome]|uniref:Transposase and inactivated derivatives n=1 Tax=hydrothermal vent metagenome TaxID=652676 RepID=A0A3B1A852_9ZZZZ
MPRRARMYLPGLPYHIVQRGNNREACFLEPDNYQFYLELWKKLSRRYGVAIHAYCLMTNHIHFLATPEHETSISTTMRVVGSRYAQYINKTYGRTGTLWEGRHRASLVQTGRYLLICMRYIELNPVRADMVARPEEYQWSSYGINAWGGSSWLQPHEEYLRLGQENSERCYAYRELFRNQLSEEDLHVIRKAAHYCQPIGDNLFRQQLEQQYGITLGRMKRGRPSIERKTNG